MYGRRFILPFLPPASLSGRVRIQNIISYLYVYFCLFVFFCLFVYLFIFLFASLFIYFFIVCVPFIILALLSCSLPVVRSSDPGSHSGPSSPLPTTVRTFVFLARRIQLFSSLVDTRRMCLPTLLGALSSCYPFCRISANMSSLSTVGIELKHQR